MVKRTHYTYVYYGPNSKPCHVDITTQELEDYESQLRNRYPCKGWVEKVGYRKTEEKAREWERSQVSAICGHYLHIGYHCRHRARR